MSLRVPLLSQPRQPGDLSGDVVAGLTTAVMLVPQGMAYAMLAGLEPIVGLYAATVPVAVYAFLGSSRQLSVGPAAMVSLLVASGIGALAGGDVVLAGGLAATLALMVGVLQLGMGVARLGSLARLLSHPVITGFTAAAAVIIGASQLGQLLGVDVPRSHHVHEILLSLYRLHDQIDPVTVLISASTVGLLALLRRHAPRFPRFLLVVVAGTVVTWWLSLDVAIVGAVPGGLPSPRLPGVSTAHLRALLPAAVTIALVGFTESISVARSFASGRRDALDADQELKALGLASIAAGIFQGYPVAGGFSRTAVNVEAGARSGLASLVTAITVAVTLLLLTPLFHHLPRAVLAAIILTAVSSLVNVAEARHLARVSRSDLGLLLLTFAATLALGIEQGILVGVLGSLSWFVWRSSAPAVVLLGQLPGTTTWRSLARNPEARPMPGVLALRIDGPLFFASTAAVQSAVMSAVTTQTAHLILSLGGVGTVDAQGLEVLDELHERLAEQEVTLWLAGARAPIRDALDAAGIPERIACFGSVQEALVAATGGLCVAAR